MDEAIIFLSLVGGLIFGAYYFSSRKVLTSEREISPISAAFSVFLAIAILILFNGLWGDMVPKSDMRYISSVMQSAAAFKSLAIHFVFVLIIVTGSLILYYGLYRRDEKYAVITFPYLLGSLIMVGRWLIEVGYFIVQEYKKMGVYAILIAMVAALTFFIFYIQQKKEVLEKIENNIKNIKKDS